ncbi:tetratricopeptide repeat protein [Candidatus Poribacteria bacterium]|nr:tetratricopeptide repeat protein [Candidatus Poribacteria bacterium]
MHRRKRYLLFVTILTTVVFIVHAQNTADDRIATDYFDHVTLFSEGRITRFTQMPIRVHISPTLRPLPYLTAIRYAMNTWESATNGKIRFQETETPEQADIHVNPTYSGRLAFLDTRLGSAKLTRLSQDTSTVSGTNPHVQKDNTTRSQNTVGGGSPAPSIDFTVEIVLVLEGDGTIGELSEAEMRTVCLHELGHAIGLWGHSPDTDDVCHATATAQHPTPRDVNTLLKVYDTPLHTPQHDIAINLLRKDLQMAPRLPRPHYLLGAVYFDKGDMTSAITHFQNCIGVDPNYEPAREKLIQAYHKIGQSNQATRLIEQRVKNQQGHRSLRDSAESYNRLGTLYYKEGDMDKAIAAFEKALKRSPHHKTAKQNLNQLYRQKAFNALKRRAFDEATAYFEKAIRLDPMNATTSPIIGDGYALASEFTQAITHYLKALALAPDDAKTRKNLALTWTNHGVTLRNNGEWDAAIRAYRNALALQPTYQLARTNMSDVLWQKANARRQSGRSDEAIAAYLELQKLQPDDPTIESLLGELYLKIRDYPAAIAAFHKVYTAQSTKQTTNEQARRNLSAAYQQYAQTLKNQRDYTASATQLQKAVDLFPKDINLRLSLSQAYQHTGEYEQAQSELEQILAQDPGNQKAKTELVNLQVRRGNTLMNRKKYAAAVAVFEGIPASEKTIDMHNMIGYLYLVQDEHLKALETFEAVLAKQPKNAVAYQNLLSLESQLDVMLSKARAAASPTPGTGEAASNPSDPTAEKLTRIQCALVRCLMNRKKPKNAMEKYQQALAVKPYAPKSRDLLIETGKQLANWFQKQNDTERYNTITQWLTVLNNNPETSSEP